MMEENTVEQVIEQDGNPVAELIDRIEKGEERLSYSALTEFAKSPRHFIAYKLREVKQTKRMKFGSLIHALILEPDEVDTLYAVQRVASPGSANQKSFAEMVAAGIDSGEAYAANYAEKNAMKVIQKGEELANQLYDYIDFLKSVGEREIVDLTTYENAERIKEQIYRNDAAMWLLEMIGETEKSIKWEYGGFQWRGYIDGLGDFVMADLKLTPDADPRKFRWKIRDMRYDWQAAFYTKLAGYADRTYNILAFDDVGNCSVIQLDESDIDRAIGDIDYYVSQFHHCIMERAWSKSFDFYAGRSGVYRLSDI